MSQLMNRPEGLKTLLRAKGRNVKRLLPLFALWTDQLPTLLFTLWIATLGGLVQRLLLNVVALGSHDSER